MLTKLKTKSAPRTTERRLLKKLGRKDSNPEKQNQNLLCYHYTTTQCFKKRGKISTSFWSAQGKAEKFPEKKSIQTRYQYWVR